MLRRRPYSRRRHSARSARHDEPDAVAAPVSQVPERRARAVQPADPAQRRTVPGAAGVRVVDHHLFRRRVLFARVQGELRRHHQRRVQAHTECGARAAAAGRPARQRQARRRAGGPARGMGQEGAVGQDRRGLLGQEEGAGEAGHGRRRQTANGRWRHVGPWRRQAPTVVPRTFGDRAKQRQCRAKVPAKLRESGECIGPVSVGRAEVEGALSKGHNFVPVHG